MRSPAPIDPFHDHHSVTLGPSFSLAKYPWHVDTVTELGGLRKEFGAASSIVGLVPEGSLQAHLRRDVVGTECEQAYSIMLNLQR